MRVRQQADVNSLHIRLGVKATGCDPASSWPSRERRLAFHHLQTRVEFLPALDAP
jgi:hypothetical protein